MNITYNRTIVELKWIVKKSTGSWITSYNRTIVELK